MDESAAKKIVDDVFRDIFGVDNPFTVEQTLGVFADAVPLPHEIKSDVNPNETTWGDFDKGEKVASQADLIVRSAKDEFMRPKTEIKSMGELQKIWSELNVHTGERYVDSREVVQSDNIYGCYGIYRSMQLYGSQHMVYCYNTRNSKNAIGAMDSESCTNCIKTDQSGYITSSYDVVWSKKVSRSMFINNCFDLYECIFCNNIRSKKYCIGNMQYEKEEYMKIKEMVIKWVLEDLKKKAKK